MQEVRKERYESLPKVTLSSLTEANRARSTIPVLKQRSYTGREVIPSALANILCANLGVHGRRGASEKLALATFFGISSALNSIISVLGKDSDYGTAYAFMRMRPYLYDASTADIAHELRTREEQDRRMRREVLVHDRITKRSVPP